MRGASGDDPDRTEDAEEADQRPASASGGSPGAGGDGRGASDGNDGSPGAGSDDGDRVESAADATVESSPPEEPPAASEIDPSELTVSERSLHPRIRILWIVRATIWALVLGSIVGAATWLWLDYDPIVPVAITAALLVLFVAHAILRYRAWNYEFREDAIYLERGVLTRVRTVVPFVRIQHIDTARGPIERAAGLSTLVVYTAGSRGADVTIPGIEADRATDHQRRLKQLAIAAEDDTAV